MKKAPNRPPRTVLRHKETGEVVSVSPIDAREYLAFEEWELKTAHDANDVDGAVTLAQLLNEDRLPGEPKKTEQEEPEDDEDEDEDED